MKKLASTGWIQIRPNVLSVLIWVQTVCKGYQQTTLVGADFLLQNSKHSYSITTRVANRLDPDQARRFTCIFLDPGQNCLQMLPADDTSCYWYVILQYSKHSFRLTTRVANKLDPDQARRFIGLDLGPNCLQRLSADDNCR